MHILCMPSFVIGKPQDHSRPQREDADEEARDNCNFHDNLLGLMTDLTMVSSESVDLGSPNCLALIPQEAV